MSAHKAADSVSLPGGVPWERTHTPWFLDPVLGEWVREDKAAGGRAGGRGPLAFIMQTPYEARTVKKNTKKPRSQTLDTIVDRQGKPQTLNSEP